MFTFAVIVVVFGLVPSLLIVMFFEVRAARERELVEAGPTRPHEGPALQRGKEKVDEIDFPNTPHLDGAWRYADRAPPE
jgi:hypothetical protein